MWLFFFRGWANLVLGKGKKRRQRFRESLSQHPRLPTQILKHWGKTGIHLGTFWIEKGLTGKSKKRMTLEGLPLLRYNLAVNRGVVVWGRRFKVAALDLLDWIGVGVPA